MHNYCTKKELQAMKKTRNPLILLARLKGFEPLTYGLEVRCSIQLSYRRTLQATGSQLCFQSADPGRPVNHGSPWARGLVGARGFEPPTPCSQSRCATRLRYTPKTGAEISTGPQGCQDFSPAPSRPEASSGQMVNRPAASRRKACPRWLMRFFAAREISAVVFPRSGT